jgi:hypothetical protein
MLLGMEHREIQLAAGSRQKKEGRGQRTEDRRQKAESGLRISDFEFQRKHKTEILLWERLSAAIFTTLTI